MIWKDKWNEKANDNKVMYDLLKKIAAINYEINPWYKNRQQQWVNTVEE